MLTRSLDVSSEDGLETRISALRKLAKSQIELCKTMVPQLSSKQLKLDFVPSVSTHQVKTAVHTQSANCLVQPITCVYN